jgi:hypothetical protein
MKEFESLELEEWKHEVKPTSEIPSADYEAMRSAFQSLQWNTFTFL